MNQYLSLDNPKGSEIFNGEDCISISNIRLSFFYYCNDEMNKKPDFSEVNKLINKIPLIECDSKNGNKRIRILHLFK